jgi:hypothetical protein
MSRPRLLIRLGPDWSRFTYERTDVELLGTVQRGAQIGALARLPDGRFAQTNGDWLQPLHTCQVTVALRRAERRPPGPRAPSSVPVRNSRPVVVVVRKGRRIPEGLQP